MDVRKIVRLAGVLLSSQLRSGRSFSDPRSFFGRPVAIAVADAIAFSFVFVVVVLGAEVLGRVQPGSLTPILASVLPFVPLLGVAAVLVGGLMFELATTTRFAASDAVNWLPIGATDYVVASSLAVASLYSLAIAVLGAVALGLGVAASALPVAALAAALGALGLVEGALLIEVMRAVTQRAGTLGRRRGGAALAIRAVAFLLVFVVFELLFNPVVLYGASKVVTDLGPVGWLVPFLWASDAVTAVLAGHGVAASLAVLADLAFLAATAFLAGRVRARFWVPIGGEVVFDAHRYAPPRATLRSFGLSRPEAALVTKDLRGLVRRRELLPVLLLPFVIAIVFLVQGGAGRSTTATAFFTLGLLAWISGLAAMIVAASSFGQERRALVHLYSTPIAPRSVLRAKVAADLAISLPTGVAIATLGIVLSRPPWLSVPGLLATVAVVIAEGTAVGLVFGTRYADFQDRPRPQFVRPLPMLGATALYSFLGGATAAVGLALSLGGPSFLTGPFAVGAAVVGLGAALVVILWAIDRGVRELFRQLPF